MACAFPKLHSYLNISSTSLICCYTHSYYLCMNKQLTSITLWDTDYSTVHDKVQYVDRFFCCAKGEEISLQESKSLEKESKLLKARSFYVSAKGSWWKGWYWDGNATAYA